MKRTDAITFHQEEAASFDKLADQAPNTPGASQCRAAASDHRSMADAARLYDYPEALED